MHLSKKKREKLNTIEKLAKEKGVTTDAAKVIFNDMSQAKQKKLIASLRR